MPKRKAKQVESKKEKEEENTEESPAKRRLRSSSENTPKGTPNTKKSKQEVKTESPQKSVKSNNKKQQSPKVEKIEKEGIETESETDNSSKKKKLSTPQKSSLGLFSSLLTPQDLKKVALLTPKKSPNNKVEIEITDEKSDENHSLWNLENKSKLIRVKGSFIERIKGDEKYACIQSKHPLDSKKTKVPYFEVLINNIGSNIKGLSIGLSPQGFDCESELGTHDDSIAYREDGMKFSGTDKGRAYGDGFTASDTIGCGIIPESGQIFFTKNGEFQGFAARISPGSPYHLYPTVCLSHESQKLDLNFGDANFVFDLKKKHFKRNSPKKLQKAEPLCGLFVDDAPFPLRAVNTRVHAIGLQAEVEMTYEYLNHLSNPINGIFVFPIETFDQITGIQVTVGDNEYSSEVVDGTDRTTKYSLPYKDSLNIYNTIQVEIKKIAPSASIRITCSYLSELKVDPSGGALIFTIPAYLDPLYSERYTEDVFDPDAVALPFVPLGFNLDLIVLQASVINEVNCINYSIKVSRQHESPNRVQVKLNSRLLSRNIEIHITPKDLFAPATWTMYNEEADTTAFLLNFGKGSGDNKRIKIDEFVIALDSTVFMKDFMNHVHIALQFFLRSLFEDVSFQVIQFGNKAVPLFPSDSTKLTVDSFHNASRKLPEISADLGKKANLLEAIKPLKTTGVSRALFILLAGEVENEEEVQQEIKTLNRHHGTNVYVIGLPTAQKSFVHLLGKIGAGVGELIDDTTKLTAALVHQLRLSITPRKSNIQIAWDKISERDFSQMPLDVPTIFDNEIFTVFGVIKGLPTENELEISTQDGIEKVPLRKFRAGNLFHRLAAKREMYDIENGIVIPESNEILPALAKKYSLLTHAEISELIMIPDSRKTPKISLSKKEEIARKLDMDLEGEEDTLLQIIKFQALDGSFDATDSLTEYLKLDINFLEEQKPKHLKIPENSEIGKRIWITALAATFILVKFQERSAETQFIVAKAKNWIKRNHAHKIPTVSILNEAEIFLKENSHSFK